MYYAMKKDIFEVHEIEGDFKVEKMDCTLYGNGDKDYMIRAMNGERDIISKADFHSNECVSVKPRMNMSDKKKEDMALGYMEMGKINLEEAEAAVHTNNDGMFE